MTPQNNYDGEFIYTEWHTRGVGIQIRVKEHLVHRRSKYQLVEMFDTYEFGRMLTLDRLVMLSERDETAYHEMLVHVPMLLHPDPRRVLVIGGGDGGSLRELLRHQTLEKAVQVEIDADVVEVCREYFPWTNAALDDPRVELVIGDAIEYVKDHAEEFDVIIGDSADPIGPAAGLFTTEFYANVHKCLKPGGLFSSQLGPAFYQTKRIAEVIGDWRGIYANVRAYLAHIPSYPSGVWTMGLAIREGKISQNPDEVRFLTFAKDLGYYNLDVHRGSFMLPEYLRRAIGG